MDTKACGCKGVRTCLICEDQTKRSNSHEDADGENKYRYCSSCGFCHRVTDASLHSLLTATTPCRSGEDRDMVQVSGITFIPHFITEHDETHYFNTINNNPWVPSQSGRFKQDFGPRVNFKRRKVKLDTFAGLPSWSGALCERLVEVDSLRGFVPVEQCHLLYESARGAHIEQHRDDHWLWGERLVTVNLLGNSVLTLTLEGKGAATVYVPMPRRSLLVLAQDARYKWQHGIERRHIEGRRVAITLRELSQQFTRDNPQISEELMQIALQSLDKNTS